MTLAGSAGSALTTGDVGLDRDQLTDLRTARGPALGNDLATQLMADDDPRGDVRGRPLAPVADVEICATDRRSPHLDEDVAVSYLWDGPLPHLQPRTGSRLDHGAHRFAG